MRPLTPDEAALLRRRTEIFPEVLDSHAAFITDLAELLGIEPSERWWDDLIGALDAFLASPDFERATPDDRAWLKVRMAAFSGEYLVKRHDGIWALQNDPDAPFFANAVVAHRDPSGAARADLPYVDVAQVAANALIVRSLRKELARAALDE